MRLKLEGFLFLKKMTCKTPIVTSEDAFHFMANHLLHV